MNVVMTSVMTASCAPQVLRLVGGAAVVLPLGQRWKSLALPWRHAASQPDHWQIIQIQSASSVQRCHTGSSNKVLIQHALSWEEKILRVCRYGHRNRQGSNGLIDRTSPGVIHSEHWWFPLMWSRWCPSSQISLCPKLCPVPQIHQWIIVLLCCWELNRVKARYTVTLHRYV